MKWVQNVKAIIVKGMHNNDLEGLGRVYGGHQRTVRVAGEIKNKNNNQNKIKIFNQ